MWYYYGPVGTFSIVPLPTGGCVLWIDNDELGTYLAPEAAAEAVCSQKTGYRPWDELPEVNPPAQLSEWMVVHGGPGMP
jgi:hypothetical protein